MDTQLERLIHGEITRGLGKQFEPRDDEQVERAFIGASREGITPPLMQYFRDAGWELRPAQLDWWRDHVARIALYRALISKLRTTLKMPYVVMKGEPLSLHLFGESLARTVTDLDVLVSADRVHDAIDQLGALGFQHLERDTIRPWAYNQVALRHVDHGAILELHWRIAMPNLPCPKTNDVLQHASHDANKTPTMRTTDLALLLAFHLFQHIGFTKGVFDCAGLVCSVAPEALGAARAFVGARISSRRSVRHRPAHDAAGELLPSSGRFLDQFGSCHQCGCVSRSGVDGEVPRSPNRPLAIDRATDFLWPPPRRHVFRPSFRPRLVVS